MAAVAGPLPSFLIPVRPRLDLMGALPAEFEAHGSGFLPPVSEQLVELGMTFSSTGAEGRLFHTLGSPIAVLACRFLDLLPPLSRAPCFTIRKRPEVIYPLSDYVTHGIMTTACAEALRAAVADRRNILIAGGTGSGKTTLANALLAEPAFGTERVVIIEDTPELQCIAPDRVELLTKRTPPPVTMADLVRMTMRLRPDRIVIGEVRGPEALDMLKAMNTGHPGSLTTVHANSAHDALLRLDDLVREAVHDVPRRTIAAAIDIIVFIERAPNGRKVGEVARVSLDPDGGYRLQPAA